MAGGGWKAQLLGQTGDHILPVRVVHSKGFTSYDHATSLFAQFFNDLVDFLLCKFLWIGVQKTMGRMERFALVEGDVRNHGVGLGLDGFEAPSHPNDPNLCHIALQKGVRSLSGAVRDEHHVLRGGPSLY